MRRRRVLSAARKDTSSSAAAPVRRGPRSAEDRIAFARELFTAMEADAWVATASAQGKEHMVPLSVAWAGDTFVVVTPERTPTVIGGVSIPRRRAVWVIPMRGARRFRSTSTPSALSGET